MKDNAEINERYLISIDLDAFDDTRVTRNSRGETIMMVNLDRTPGIHRAANGNYYLNLVAIRKRTGMAYGTHLLARYLKAEELKRLRAEGKDYPPVGNLSPWDSERALRISRKKHLREWGIDPDEVDAYWDGEEIQDEEEEECDQNGGKKVQNNVEYVQIDDENGSRRIYPDNDPF